MFETDPPHVNGQAHIVERRGCELHPIDATTAAGALLLRSFVWADLADHVRILDEAIAISRSVTALVDQADGADWLPRRLVGRGRSRSSSTRRRGPPARRPAWT